jgi:hypothetical protein
MRDIPIPPTKSQSRGRQISEALAHLDKIVVDGLRHGFFECSVTCQIMNGGTRQLVVRAGKSYQFNIRQEELER